MTAGFRYSATPGGGGDWLVVDQDRDDATVAQCADSSGAELIAALMNGDLTALAEASAETLLRCRNAVSGVLRVLKPFGRPSVGSAAFPEV